jgi:hypothetical protein
MYSHYYSPTYLTPSDYKNWYIHIEALKSHLFGYSVREGLRGGGLVTSG